MLTKNGTGVLALTNANTFQGRALVAFGVLDVRNAFALGAGDGTTNTDTTVNAGLQPYVATPASQVKWAQQAKALFGRTPMWISEWGLNRADYPTLAAYSDAMTSAVTALHPLVDVLCYATFTPSATSNGLVQPGLTGYRRIQPAYDTYHSWPKR